MMRVTGIDAARWAQSFDRVLKRITELFGRAEAYLRGLLAPVERTNGWQLTKAAGNATPGRV